MLEKAMHLCDGAQGTLWVFNGEHMRAAATAGYSRELAEQLSEWREIHPFQGRLLQGERVFQIIDLAAEELYRSGSPLTRAAVDVAGIRTVVFVALVKDTTTLGGFTIGRRAVRAFTKEQISLLRNFAAQAVIAMENARLITETREALEQQTAWCCRRCYGASTTAATVAAFQRMRALPIGQAAPAAPWLKRWCGLLLASALTASSRARWYRCAFTRT